MRQLELFRSKVVGSSGKDFDYDCIIAPSGDFKRVEDINAIILSITNIMLTPLGSYVFDPEYGTELYKKVFEPQDDITEDEIREEIYYRIGTVEERASIEDVRISWLTNRKGFSVDVLVEYFGTKGVVRVTFDENLVKRL